MSNKIKLSATLALGLLTTLAAGPARATQEFTNGITCNPGSGSIQYGNFGVDNTSTSASATVWCSPTHAVGANITSLAVGVYDRHSSQGVCCKFSVTDMGGNPSWSSANQCSTSTGFSFLNFTPPANINGVVNLSCTIPPKTSGGSSHVTSMLVQ
jgi:hypothetical protein